MAYRWSKAGTAAEYVFPFQLRKLGFLVGGKDVVELGPSERMGRDLLGFQLAHGVGCGLNSGGIVGLNSRFHSLVGAAFGGMGALAGRGFGGEEGSRLLNLSGSE